MLIIYNNLMGLDKFYKRLDNYEEKVKNKIKKQRKRAFLSFLFIAFLLALGLMILVLILYGLQIMIRKELFFK